MNETCIVITGPTGVGKTAYVDELASRMPIEVVNADIGQMYTPLTIGTAKPDWRNASVVHHMFDIIDTPRDCTVAEYRSHAMQTLHDIFSRDRIPVIVGGSLFYIQSLFFPPSHIPHVSQPPEGDVHTLWRQLYEIDPERANAIHPHDVYRVKRALSIWYATGEKPSTFQPQFMPPSSAIISFLTRDRDELYHRINERTHHMIESGWIEEVRQLSDEWKTFVKHKHILGYPEVAAYIDGDISYENMVEDIQKQTRAYAKRQITFWRSMSKKLSHGYAHHDAYRGTVMTLSMSDNANQSNVEQIYRAYYE